MPRLRIGVEQLGAEGLRIELDGDDGAPNVLAFAPGGGVHGRYEQDDATIGLHDLRADTLVLSEFTWALPMGRIRGVGRLLDVEIEVELATARNQGEKPPFCGSVRARKVELTADITLDHVDCHAATVEFEGFELSAGPDGMPRLRIDRAKASTLRARHRDGELIVGGLSLPDGVLVDGPRVHVDTVAIETIDAQLTNLASLLAKSDGAVTPGPSNHERLDVLSAIADAVAHLQGHVAAELVTDLTVPILGSHAAIHSFRIPIDDGTIEFAAIERGLSTLADMVLDFEVKGDCLILEKDLPLVPFDNQTLIEWPLDAHGRALAKHKRVRLADLLFPRFPASARRAAQADATRGRSLAIRSIALRQLEIALAIGSPLSWRWPDGAVELGSPARLPWRSLDITGALTYADGTAQPGTLEASITDVHAGSIDVAIGATRVTTGPVDIETATPLRLALAGVQPAELSLHAGPVRACRVMLESS